MGLPKCSRPMAWSLAALVALAGCTAPQQLPGTSAGEAPKAGFTFAASSRLAFAFEAALLDAPGRVFRWDFGDGARAEGRTVEHAFPGDGAYGVTLWVLDGGAARSVVQAVKVGSGTNRAPTAALALSTRWVGSGDVVNASALGSTDPDGDAVSHVWGLYYHGERAPEAAVHAHADAGPTPAAPDRASYKPQDNGFDSPIIEADGQHNLTLSRPGLYMYHCHPHPWMTGTILVQPGAPAEERPLLMKDAQWFLPGHSTVGPGSKLTWTNDDPVWHTVTLSGFHPMTEPKQGGAEARFRLPEEGVYELTLVIHDARGAANATSQLVLVTRLPPPTKYVRTWMGTFDLAAPDQTADHDFELPFPGNGTFTFTWSSIVPLAKAKLQVFASASAKGEPVLEIESGRGEARLSPGPYTLHVIAENGVQVAYDIGLSATLEPEPDFGGPGHGGH